VEIEAGRNSSSVHILRKLADALGITVDDVIPVADGEACQNKDVTR
jgi:transcriptional regulator with XRE-family HTH domain